MTQLGLCYGASKAANGNKANDEGGNLGETTLAATPDALLPKLLSGEIRVKDAEKFVEAHV